MAQNVGDIFVRLGLEMSQFAKGLESAQDKLGQMGRDFQSIGTTLSIGITAPLTAIAAQSIKTAEQFSTAMNSVEAVTKNGSERFEELSAKAQEMGLTTRYSAVEAAEGMAFLGKAGLEAQVVLDSIPTTLNLAAAANLDLASSADIVTNVMQGFQMTSEEMAGAADVLALAFTSSNTDLLQLGDAFKYAGPVAKGMNLTFEETVAVLGTLSNAGIQASMAGTTLRGALTKLTGPSKQGAEAMEKYAISVSDSQGKMLPFRDILGQFQDALKNSSSEVEFMSDLVDIFGQRAGPGMAALIGVGKDAIAQFTKELEGAEGTTQRIKDIQLKGLSGAMITLKSAMEGASLAIGQALAPVVIRIADYLREGAILVAKLAKWFQTLPQPVQDFAIAIGAAAAALGPAMFLLGAFLNQVAGLKLLVPTLQLAGGYFVKFGGQFKTLGSVLKSVNIGAIFKSINSATVAFGSTFINTMKGIPGALAAVPGAVKGVGTSILTTVKGLGPAIVGAGAGIKGAIMGIVSSLTGVVTSLMAPGGVAAAFAAVKGAVIAFGAAVASIGWPVALIAAALVALGAAAYTLYKHWEDVKAVMIGLWKDLSIFIKKAAETIWGWIEGALGSEAAGWIKKVWSGIANFLKKAWSTILDIFENGLKYIVEYAAKAAHALGMENTAKALDAWYQKLSTAREEVEDLDSSSEELSKTLDNQNNTLDDNAGGWDNAGDSMEAYAKHMEEVNKAVEAGDKILQDIPDSIREILSATRQSNLPAEWRAIDQAIADAKKKMDEFAQANWHLGDDIAPQLREMQEEINKLEKEAEEFKQADLAKSFEDLNASLLKSDGKIEDLGKEFTFLADQTQKFIESAGAGFRAVDEAIEGLGIKADHLLEKQIEQSAKWLSDIEAGWKRGEASINDYTRAVDAAFTKQIELYQRLGKDTTELEKAWEATNVKIVEAGGSLNILTAEAKKGTQEVGFMAQQVSTVMTDLSKGIADAILEGKNFGEVFRNTFKSVGEAIIRYGVETLTKNLLTAIFDVEAATKGLGAIFNDVFGGLNKLIGSGGGAGGLGGGIGNLGSGLAGGLTGLVGAIGSIGSMITGIIGAFQNARQENTLNAIEENTRYIKIWTGEQEWSIQNNTGHIREGVGYLNASLDDVKSTLWEMAELAKLATAAVIEGSEVSMDQLNTLLDSMAEQVKATEEVKTATQETTDKTEEVKEATQGVQEETSNVASQVHSSAQTFTAGTTNIANSVDRQTQETRQVVQGLDDWGAVLSEVGYELNEMGQAVKKQSDSLAQLVGIGGGGTQDTNTPVDVKQLFYLRHLAMLDTPLSQVEDLFEDWYKEWKKQNKVVDDSYDELENLNDTSEDIADNTGDLADEQERTTREISDGNRDITSSLTENTRATLQSGQSLGITMGEVSSAFKTGMTDLGTSINKSMTDMGTKVAGAVTTVGKIQTVYVPNAGSINPTPSTGGGGGGSSPGISGGAYPGASYIDLNAQSVTGAKTVNLNVNYTNGDARDIANQMVSEWRRAGVDI